MITMTDAEAIELQDFLNTSKAHIEALAGASAGWQARAESAEAVLSQVQAERDEYRAELARVSQQAINAEDEAEQLREQVAALTAQLQEVRTEYRVACEDFNELLDKTSDW